MTTFELKHISGNDDNDLQVSNEEDDSNGHVNWIDTPSGILKSLTKLFNKQDQLVAPAICLRIVLQQAYDDNQTVEQPISQGIDVNAKTTNPSLEY